jgi:lipoprotein-releasing system permease protein
MIVNLITIAVVTGFQQEVRQKVSGFGSHLFIMGASEYSIYESSPIRADQRLLDDLKSIQSIAAIHPVAYKPILFQSEAKEIHYTLSNGKDTSEIDQNVFGATLKGIDGAYNLDFFREHLKKGKLPNYKKERSNEILISEYLANKLHFKVGDEVDAFFVRTAPVKRKFKIKGIYHTGMQEFDSKIVLADLRYVQELNDWGIQSSIEIADTLHQGQLIISANIAGGNGNYRCNWGNGFEGYTRFTHCPIKDTTIRLIASDFFGNIHVPVEQTTMPDTSYLKIRVASPPNTCFPDQNELGEVKKQFIDETGNKFTVLFDGTAVSFDSEPGKGSSRKYVGGFEVNIRNWDDLDHISEELKDLIELVPTEHNELLRVMSIKESQEEIFVWLGFLDINVLIILILMLLIGVINMGSALLVLILVKTNQIGLLKAMGATNWSIRKIFLYQSAFLIGKGMLWGNIIGLLICWLQVEFKFMTLNPAVYYLSEVPMNINIWHWLLLNIGTLFICVCALILPSIVITRISPVKAIRFN